MVAFVSAVVLLFVGGMAAAYLSRHDTICPDRKVPLKEQDNGLLGQTVYLCQNGATVTK
jgi:hypothetical protein